MQAANEIKSKSKRYLKDSWSEFKSSCFKRPVQSRIIWGLASAVTFGFAYLFQINSGHSLAGDPWSNPFGQLCSAFALVGWIAGGFGLLLFSVLGLKGKEDADSKRN